MKRWLRDHFTGAAEIELEGLPPGVERLERRFLRMSLRIYYRPHVCRPPLCECGVLVRRMTEGERQERARGIRVMDAAPLPPEGDE